MSFQWIGNGQTLLHSTHRGTKSEPKNYRPVSLTSICCKLMEKLVRSQIMKYLKRVRLLHDKLHGFLPGRSTTLQLLKVMDEWTEAVDRGKEVDVIYLDFKAFDSVPHIRLINILEQYGTRDENLQWIEQFLKSREQRVIANKKSPCWALLSTTGRKRAFSSLTERNAFKWHFTNLTPAESTQLTAKHWKKWARKRTSERI